MVAVARKTNKTPEKRNMLIFLFVVFGKEEKPCITMIAKPTSTHVRTQIHKKKRKSQILYGNIATKFYFKRMVENINTGYTHTHTFT